MIARMKKLSHSHDYTEAQLSGDGLCCHASKSDGIKKSFKSSLDSFIKLFCRLMPQVSLGNAAFRLCVYVSRLHQEAEMMSRASYLSST